MPDLEINSPMDSSISQKNFQVRGNSDLAAGIAVTVTVSGGGITGSPGGPYNTFTTAGGMWEVTTATGPGKNYKIVADAPATNADSVDQIDVDAAPPNIIGMIVMPMAAGRSTITASGTVMLVNNSGADTDVFVLIHVFRGKKRHKVFAAKSVDLSDNGDGTASWTETFPVPNDTDRIVVQALRINRNNLKVLDRASKKA
jgi:hypothetical protein